MGLSSVYHYFYHPSSQSGKLVSFHCLDVIAKMTGSGWKILFNSAIAYRDCFLTLTWDDSFSEFLWLWQVLFDCEHIVFFGNGLNKLLFSDGRSTDCIDSCCASYELSKDTDLKDTTRERRIAYQASVAVVILKISHQNEGPLFFIFGKR